MRPSHRLRIFPGRQITSPSFSPTTKLSCETLSHDADFLTHFRTHHFVPTRPAYLPGHYRSLPAISKWFQSLPRINDPTARQLDNSFLAPYAQAIVNLELTRQPGSSKAGSKSSSSEFERFAGPLGLLLQWMETALAESEASSQRIRIYLAQTSLMDLPSTLAADLPTPEIVLRAGRGDVYGSSLWMGIPPTSTPLHMDPNPNVLVQLAGRKIVRMLAPEAGKEVLMKVGGMAERRPGMGDEMMVGEDMRRVEDWVWGDEGEFVGAEGLEVELGEGDGVFIPKGWWHSVKGVGNGVTASANWWFR